MCGTCLKWEHTYFMIHLDNEQDCVVPNLCVDLLLHVPILFMSARVIILDCFPQQLPYRAKIAYRTLCAMCIAREKVECTFSCGIVEGSSALQRDSRGLIE